MSQIKLKHSGGNSVIIAAPDSNPASDRTLKLPSDGDGTILTSNSSVGKILQVVSTTKTDTASHSVGVGSVSGDVITTSITPSSASNKILVICSIWVGTPDEGAYGTFYRGGSVITAATGDSNSNRQRVSVNSFVINDNRSTELNKTFLDSPSTTSSTTYSVRIGGSKDGTTTYYVNRPYQWADDNRRATGISTLTLMEIAT